MEGLGLRGLVGYLFFGGVSLFVFSVLLICLVWVGGCAF